LKITQISPQFNCIVCKNHDRYYSNSISSQVWTFLRCNCGAEYTLCAANSNKDISFNSKDYNIISFYYKSNKFIVYLDSNAEERKINNNYYGDIKNLFNKKSITKIISDMDKSIIFQK